MTAYNLRLDADGLKTASACQARRYEMNIHYLYLSTVLEVKK